MHAFGRGGPLRADTELSLTASMLPNANIYGSTDTPSGKSLSAKIEARVCQRLFDPSSKERHRLAHFVLNRVPGVGAWLFALPDSPETHIPPPLFRVSLRRRLRMPIWSQDSNCSFCGQVLDKWITLWLVGAVGIGSLVTTSSATSTQLPMIVPIWPRFSRSLAFLFLETLLVRIAHQTGTRPTRPISLVDRQMCGSHDGAPVEGLRHGTSPSPAPLS